MLKVGLIGFGFMGNMHFENYIRLAAEGFPLQLTAICDVRIEELKNASVVGNIATTQSSHDLSPYRLYTDIEDMLSNEELDYIDITLPTHLHADFTERMLERGLHVLCEKPMARTFEEGRRMADTAMRTGKKLMIAQCLRFWPAYEYLKTCVEDGRYGLVTGGSFYRGGAFPGRWYQDKAKSGGCLLDMHIHDVDVIHWLFGLPDRVSVLGRNVIPGSGYDIVSAHYGYEDGKVVNAQADWTLQGDYGFAMTYRVNFERGNLVFENGVLKVNPETGTGFIPELSPDMGYYREIRYFAEALINDSPVAVSSPESTLETMAIIEAEMLSVDGGGEWVRIGEHRLPVQP